MGPDTRPTVPPVLGGIFRERIGSITGPLEADDLKKYNAAGKRTTESRWNLHPWDLIELVSVAVPVAELEHLRRAQAACLSVAADGFDMPMDECTEAWDVWWTAEQDARKKVTP